jgi:hypothetical protein
VDETGNDLSLSPGTETSPTSREFCVPGVTKLARKSEIFFIKDQDDQIIDAIMMSENPEASWSKESFITAENLLVTHNAWFAANKVFSQYATATRTICRDESLSDSNTANDWYITATSSATPGSANNPKRHEVKD